LDIVILILILICFTAFDECVLHLRMSAPVYEEFADDAILSSGLHKHCYTCYSFTLCSRDGDGCDFIQCPKECGAVFHSCKESEHGELCLNAVVSCLNAAYGCGRELTRRDLGRHLTKCPASVVMCMAEWNRWPVYCKERQRHIPFRQKNPCEKTAQLGAYKRKKVLRCVKYCSRIGSEDCLVCIVICK
jgi:hypothetical protein